MAGEVQKRWPGPKPQGVWALGVTGLTPRLCSLGPKMPPGLWLARTPGGAGGGWAGAGLQKLNMASLLLG